MYSSFNVHNHPLEAGTVIIPHHADAEPSTQRLESLAQGYTTGLGRSWDPTQAAWLGARLLATTLSSSKIVTYNKSEHLFGDRAVSQCLLCSCSFTVTKV